MRHHTFLLEPLEPRRLAASLPPGFNEQLVAAGLSSPTSMALLPDGRILVSEQSGALRVISPATGGLLPQPMLQLAVDYAGERGLVGVAVDSNFADSPWVYLFYTTEWGTGGRISHGRVSRFPVTGNTADPAGEQVLLEFDDVDPVGTHNGGAMKFGVDGMLYIGVGDNGNPLHAQQADKFAGKLYRITPEGDIPADNPYYNHPDLVGSFQAIYALGLRNPFSIDVDPGTGRIFANDVGQSAWEEINEILPTGNYGWPLSEGPFDPVENPGYTPPLLAYPHVGDDCAITGGAFYNPPLPTFGNDYVGDYFFMDFCGNWIKRLEFGEDGTTSVAGFATDLPSFSVGLTAGPDGSLYFLSLSDGSLRRIVSDSVFEPQLVVQPSDQVVSTGSPVSFSVEATGFEPLTYQWFRDGARIEDATEPMLTLPAVAMPDDGAEFFCRVSNAFGHADSDIATLTVTARQPPIINIVSPSQGTVFSGGMMLDWSGFAFSPTEGLIDPAQLVWRIDFHHDDHIHPFMPATSGVSSGTIPIPDSGHVETNVWYRVLLTATDSQGMSSTGFVDVHPVIANLTLETTPLAGMTLFLDGAPVLTPLTFEGVAGVRRQLEAPALFGDNGQEYEFVAWSDGGSRVRELLTPATDTTFTARYRDITPPGVASMEFLWEPPVPGGTPRQQLLIRFTEDVSASLERSDLEFVRVTDGFSFDPDATELVYDVATNTASIRFPGLPDGMLPDGDWLVSLGGGQVTDSGGLPNPALVDLFTFSLLADCNRDRRVDIDDFSILALHMNEVGTLPSSGDVNNDGETNIEDFGVLAVRFNMSLDVPAATPARVFPPVLAAPRFLRVQRIWTELDPDDLV